MSRKDILENLRSEINSIEESSAMRASINETTSRFREAQKFSESPETSSGVPREPLDAAEALKKILALVNVSDKSERTIRMRLQRDGFSEATVDEAVARAIEYGFVDDMRYAEVLVRSRISQGKGSAGIERELAENGIDPDMVPGWPHEYPLSHDEEISRALSLLERKPPRSKNAREAAYRRLMQKGYPSAVASSAARMWTER